MREEAYMNSEKLLKELEENACLDLHKLYYANPDKRFYALLVELYQLRKQHGLTTRLSPYVTEIESLIKALGLTKERSLSDEQKGHTVTAEQFDHLVETLDFNQRAHRMSRFILTKDNHKTFSKPVELVMYGDSITEWGPWHDAFSGFQVANRGLAGDTTAGMLERIDTTLVCQPKLVCIMAGINDLAQGYSVQQVVENYRRMLAIWQEHGIEVWVQSTLYVGERMSSLNPLVSELNRQLRQICQAQSLRFIDLNATLCPEQTLPLECSCDDLHLNSHAYAQWLSVLTPMLDARFAAA